MMEFVSETTERLDHFLVRMLPGHSRSKLAKIISAGEVTVNDVVRKPSFELREGMVVALEEVRESEAHDLTPIPYDLDILYEDDDMLIVNKPRGMASHPAHGAGSPTLVHALLARAHGLSGTAGAFRPGIVHRLDKETTGLMVVAKNDAAHVKLSDEIAEKRAERRYVALVRGTPTNDRFTVDAPIGRDPNKRIAMKVVPLGKHALTHCKVLCRGVHGNQTVIACRLETGRTHQIRVHLTAIGHPVIGDPVYSPVEPSGIPMQLHAALIRIHHPVRDEVIEIYGPPPEDFIARDLIDPEQIRHWGNAEH